MMGFIIFLSSRVSSIWHNYPIYNPYVHLCFHGTLHLPTTADGKIVVLCYICVCIEHTLYASDVLFIAQQSCLYRDHSRYGFSQWETTLHCNAVAHWLNPYTEWHLLYDANLSQVPMNSFNLIETPYSISHWLLFVLNQHPCWWILFACFITKYIQVCVTEWLLEQRSRYCIIYLYNPI